MAIEKTKKQDLIKEFKTSSRDTGSSNVQIALLTERINGLTSHFKNFKKDRQSRLGLLKLVSQRRRLLDYLKRRDVKKYDEIIKKLKIRK